MKATKKQYNFISSLSRIDEILDGFLGFACGEVFQCFSDDGEEDDEQCLGEGIDGIGTCRGDDHQRIFIDEISFLDFFDAFFSGEEEKRKITYGI